MRFFAYSRLSILRRTFLAVAPLAVLGLVQAATSRAAAISSPTFGTGGTVTYGSNSVFSYTSGALSSAALPQGANKVTGAKYFGGPVIFTANALSGGTGVVMEVTINGSGSGVFSPASDTFSGLFHFDLESSSAQLTNSSWNINFTVVTTAGNTSENIGGFGGGDVTGAVQFPIAGADTGASLLSYKVELAVGYTDALAPAGSTLSITVPSNSLDFNAIPNPSAVPEPGTWALLLAGGLVMGVLGRRGVAGVRR